MTQQSAEDGGWTQIMQPGTSKNGDLTLLVTLPTSTAISLDTDRYHFFLTIPIFEVKSRTDNITGPIIERSLLACLHDQNKSGIFGRPAFIQPIRAI